MFHRVQAPLSTRYLLAFGVQPGRELRAEVSVNLESPVENRIHRLEFCFLNVRLLVSSNRQFMVSSHGLKRQSKATVTREGGKMAHSSTLHDI